jgi:serine/threonine protein kinase
MSATGQPKRSGRPSKHPASADIAPGTVIGGKYRIDAVLGQGGMSVVYAATHQALGQQVAIKLVPPDAGITPGHAARMLREARAAATLSSENVARVLDVGEVEPGEPYIVMELLEGEDLARLLNERGHLEVREAAGYLLQACDAIAEAHAKGIVHRDLKPSNLFVTRRRDGTALVKLLDFGISKQIDVPPDELLTSTQDSLGTPHYMSPEQLLSSRDVDSRTDIWSLGVILFKVLAGRNPFEGDTTPALHLAILTGPAPRLRDVLPEAPEEIDELVARCLVKSRDQRLQTVTEFASVLARFASGPTRPPAARRRRARVPRAVVAAAMLCGVAAGGAILKLWPAAPSSSRGAALEPTTSPSGAPSVPSDPASAAPVPATAEARASWQAALQSFRDGRVEAWGKNLEDVLRSDPGFGPAHLWLAFVWLGKDDTRARADYDQAVQHRATLGELDAALLDALEPRFRDPPDRGERLLRMQHLAERRPRDAVVLYMLGLAYLSLFRHDEATDAFERARAVDPQFAFAYENLIYIAEYRGNLEDARRIVDHCVEAVPQSTGCAARQVGLDDLRGDCRAVLANGRAVISRDPASEHTLDRLAGTLASTGESIATVREMLRRADAADTQHVDYYAHMREASADEWYGDFVAARGETEAAQAVLKGDPDGSPIPPEIERAQILEETGDGPALRSLVASLRAHVGAWSTAPESTESIVVSGYERRTGAITAAELRARRDEWMRARAEARRGDGSLREPFWDWIVAYGAMVDGREDALQALQVLAGIGPVPSSALIDPSASAALGRVYVLAERYADALPLLRFATQTCNALAEPIARTRALYDLTLALARTGALVEMRPIRAALLARWGSARPRSTTAEKVRALGNAPFP